MPRTSVLPPLCLLVISVAFVPSSSSAAPDPAKKEARQEDPFGGQIRPLLTKYCVDCHGSSKPKAGLNLKKVAGEEDILKDRKLWGRLVGHVEAGEMPPDDRLQPTDDEVERFRGAVDAVLARVDCGREADPGRVTIRRLNRAEYNNTIRDLIGIDFQPADDFPSDDVGYGFDNIGDVLTLPPILFEKYLAAAESIAEQAIVVGPGSKGPTRTWEGETLARAQGGKPAEDGGRLLWTNGEVVVDYAFPGDGEYLLRARVYGQQAGPDPARMAIRLDGKDLVTFDVAERPNAPRAFEARGLIKGGTHRIAVAFLNDYYNPDEPDQGRRDRNLVVTSIAVQGPVVTGPDSLPESHRRIIFCTPTPETRNECARAIIERFATRAFRRQVTAGEVGRL